MAIKFVETQTASNNTGTATTGTFAATVATNQLIVVTYADDSSTTTTFTSMTDNKGNTYTPVAAFLTNSVSYRMFYAITTTGGSGLIVTANWSTAAAARCTLVAQYFNGFTGTPTIDKTTGTTGSSTTASPGTTGATTNANEVVIIGAAHAATASAFSLGTGYTNLGQVSVANAQSAQESKVVSSSGTQTGNMTIAASRAWTSQIATFYDATGGGPNPPSAGTMLTLGVGM